MMKGLTKWIIFVIFLAVCIQGVSAAGFSVTSISVDPQGAMVPGTPVTASFKVDVSGQFPSDEDLQFFTDLTNPKWTYTILVNGIENVRPSTGGRTLDITGFELNYKSTDEVSVRATLEGAAPTVTSTSNQTVFRITEVDSRGNSVTSTQVTRTAIVVNTGQVTQAIADQETALQTFRSHIDEKAAIGIDTSEAEGKYNEAQQDVNAAKALPTSQYLAALNDLNAAQVAITAGEVALDKAWAQSEVDAAQVPINNVDGIIAWFNGNQSTANDAQLPAIITKREVAVSYISTANDEIANGNYEQARAKAQDAFSKGNESYNDALARQDKLTHGFDIMGMIGGVAGSIGVVVIGVIAVVLIVVGIVIYRKRSRWDELG
jgi:hypothetical protein